MIEPTQLDLNALQRAIEDSTAAVAAVLGDLARRLPADALAPNPSSIGAGGALASSSPANLSNPALGAEVQRTPDVWVPLPKAGLEFAASEAKTVWTPAAGKRFRVLGWTLRNNQEGNPANQLDLLDLATRWGALGTNINSPLTSPPLGNGYLSIAANNTLRIQPGAACVLSGMFWGTEE
jgi:hypothetical protein